MITIIVPCYNASAVLQDAYASLPEGEHKPGGHELEIIIADDGSKDGSQELIARLAADDSRIKPLYNMKNIGVSGTRNAALRQASGDLIFFMDADDKLLPDALDTLVAHMHEDVDFVRGKHLLWNAETDACTPNAPEEQSFSEVHGIVPEACPQISAIYSSWNALLRRSIIEKDNIVFPTSLRIGEDRIFIARYLWACREITLLDDYTYHWRKGSAEVVQATQVLVKDPDHMFKSILASTQTLQESWFHDNKKHRDYLATLMLIELCNNLTAFSKQFNKAELSVAARNDVLVVIASLQPEWIISAHDNFKGNVAVYQPLYEYMMTHIGQTADDLVFKGFFKILSDIRKSLNAPKDKVESEMPVSLLLQVFQTARSLRSERHQTLEVSILHDCGLFDAAVYKAKNPDIVHSSLDPEQHYLQFGAGELRNPNGWFDTATYFSQHPELVLTGVNPLVHYALNSTLPTIWKS